MTPTKSKKFLNIIPRLITAFFTIFIFLLLVESFFSYRRISPYLSDEMYIFPPIFFQKQDLENMDKKFSIFSDPKLNTGQNIFINSSELNLILKNKLNLGNKIRADIKDNKIYLLFCFPIPLFNKFFNGCAVIDIIYQNNKLYFDILNLSANDLEVDNNLMLSVKELIIMFKEKNNFINNFLNKFSVIQIKGNQIFFTFK